MTDSKLTDLAAITAITTDDLVYIVDDPLGTPASKKITFDNFQKSIKKTANATAFVEVVNNGTQSVAPTTFTQITSLSTVNFDPGSNWDNTNHYYVVPVSGVYKVTTKLRLNDNTAAPNSYGQGADISLGDGSNFQWFMTQTGALNATNRNGSLNVRTTHYTAGDHIMMQMYWDAASGNCTVNACAMSVELLYAD